MFSHLQFGLFDLDSGAKHDTLLLFSAGLVPVPTDFLERGIKYIHNNINNIIPDFLYFKL